MEYLVVGHFQQYTMTVAVEQLAQVVNLHTQLVALVRIAHPHAMGGHLHQLCGRLDVYSPVYGILGT